VQTTERLIEPNRITTSFIRSGLLEKEASESEYWLELLQEAHIGDAAETGDLLRECRELIAIFTAIGKTAKARRAAKNLAKLNILK
jgi:four helix bundle protein